MGSVVAIAPTELLFLRDMCSAVDVVSTELLSLRDMGVSGWGGAPPGWSESPAGAIAW